MAKFGVMVLSSDLRLDLLGTNSPRVYASPHVDSSSTAGTEYI